MMIFRALHGRKVSTIFPLLLSIKQSNKVLSFVNFNNNNKRKAASFSTTAIDSNAAVPEKKSLASRIPWGIILPIGFISSIIFYFYRENKAKKEKKKQLALLRLLRFCLSAEEIEAMRETNQLSLPHFKELCKRIDQVYGKQRKSIPAPPLSATEFYFDFVPNQLGGEFQAKGSFNSYHLFERLALVVEKNVDKKENYEKFVDALLCGASLAVSFTPKEYRKSTEEEDELKLVRELLDTLYDALKEKDSREDTMSFTRFAYVLELLLLTNQLPARILIEEKSTYPLKTFSILEPLEVLQKTLEEIKKEEEKKQSGWFSLPKNKPPPENYLQKTFTKTEFVELLLNKKLCFNGKCTLAGP